MAVTNAFSNVYLSGPTGQNKFYLDAEPAPFPEFTQNFFGAIKRTIPTKSGSTVQSGVTVAFSNGSDISAATLDISVQYMLQSTYIQLITLRLVTSQVAYSPDNGLTVYLCNWIPGPLNFKRIPGSLTYAGTIKLQVMSQSVGSGGFGGPGGGS